MSTSAFRSTPNWSTKHGNSWRMPPRNSIGWWRRPPTAEPVHSYAEIHTEGAALAVIDPTRTWQPLEKRLADTTSERQRVVLNAVIEHMKAEAAPDFARLMATLSPNPDYHFWGAEGDTGPKTTKGVREYYTQF